MGLLSILCSNHEILGFKKMFQYPLMTNKRACESAIELTLKCYERTLAIMRVEVEYFHSILKMIEFSIQTIRVPSYWFTEWCRNSQTLNKYWFIWCTKRPKKKVNNFINILMISKNIIALNRILWFLWYCKFYRSIRSGTC